MELKLFGMILFIWLWFVTSSPLHPRTLLPERDIKKGSYIRHYSGAFYDVEALKQYRGQMRKNSSELDKRKSSIHSLNLHLDAFERQFKIKLVRDSSVCHEDIELMSNDRSISFDPSNIYRGSLEDDETALVFGLITSEGLFDGTIITASEEIYIEPASRYSTLIQHHTIAYRSSDIATPDLSQPTHSAHRLDNLSALDANQFYRQDLNYDEKDWDYHHSLDLNPDDVLPHQVEQFDKFYNTVVQKHPSIDPKKTTCMMYLQADHTFVEHYSSEEACIEVMIRHVQRVNTIYQYTDFDQDGQPDSISFMIKRIKIYGPEALKDSSYRFTGKYGVEQYLEIFSEENYDAFCLAYMFTYRDFEKGTLGLAWTGDLKNAGGVCEKNGHYRGSMKSLNTGIITLLNYGKHVPPAVSHVTLAHEIGHNFGSPHDPDECSPGGEDGNFIMFSRATSGDKKNNNRFSPCSLISINPVLNAKARSFKGCFAEHQTSICGNGVVEEGEECDCGWEEDCHDICCHPQRLHHAPFEIPCRLVEDAVCSPSQGPCCTHDCSLRIGTKCRDDNGCRDASFCDGRAPECPKSVNKPNKTICNDEFVCYMGECTGSICLAYGLESCQCTAEPGDPPTKSCELCCKLPGENPCLSSFVWNSSPYEIPDMMSKPGTPCNNYNGYCDIFQKCREVDPTGPLATLRRFLLSDASLAHFQRWITDRWYFAVFGGFIVASALIIITRLLSKGNDTKIFYINDDSMQCNNNNNNQFSLNKMNKIKQRLVETFKIIASPKRKKQLGWLPNDSTVNCKTENLTYDSTNQILQSINLNFYDESFKLQNNCTNKSSNENLYLQENWPYGKFMEKFYLFDKTTINNHSSFSSSSLSTATTKHINDIAHLRNNFYNNNNNNNYSNNNNITLSVPDNRDRIASILKST